MKLNLGKTFRYYFPSSFELFVTGICCFILSSAGIGLIFINHDAVFPKMFSTLREIGITWGCVTFILGLFFIFWGIRECVPAGTTAYRLTHPRFLPRG